MYTQLSNKDEFYRHSWVIDILQRLVSENEFKTLIDIGAGPGIYAEFIKSLGVKYTSQDFMLILENERRYPGLLDKKFQYQKMDITCDVLDIPEDKKFDIVLCTEVLEHVPDPARVFIKLSKLVDNQGYIVLSCPLISVMHQAPFWFQSGLSPYWFQYWAEQSDIEIVSIEIYGDYIDMMVQEVSRLFSFHRGLSPFLWILIKIIKSFRFRIQESTLTSGGLGVLVIAKPKH